MHKITGSKRPEVHKFSEKRISRSLQQEFSFLTFSVYHSRLIKTLHLPLIAAGGLCKALFNNDGGQRVGIFGAQ